MTDCASSEAFMECVVMRIVLLPEAGTKGGADLGQNLGPEGGASES